MGPAGQVARKPRWRQRSTEGQREPSKTSGNLKHSGNTSDIPRFPKNFTGFPGNLTFLWPLPPPCLPGYLDRWPRPSDSDDYPTSVRCPVSHARAHCFGNRDHSSEALAEEHPTGAVPTESPAEKRAEKPRFGYSGLDIQVRPPMAWGPARAGSP